MPDLHTLDDIWRNVSGHIEFYTYQTHTRIPEQAGIYGWLLPFRISNDMPEKSIKDIHKIMLYDSVSKGPPSTSADANLTWQKILVSLSVTDRSEEYINFSDARWKNIQGDEETFSTFKKSMMIASLFSQPLYVGLTNDLSTRYLQHVHGTYQGNSFHERFTKHMKDIGLSIKLSDLLFVALPIEIAEAKKALNRDQIIVIEAILKRVCRPIFGER